MNKIIRNILLPYRVKSVASFGVVQNTYNNRSSVFWLYRDLWGIVCVVCKAANASNNSFRCADVRRRHT